MPVKLPATSTSIVPSTVTVCVVRVPLATGAATTVVVVVVGGVVGAATLTVKPRVLVPLVLVAVTVRIAKPWRRGVTVMIPSVTVALATASVPPPVG